MSSSSSSLLASLGAAFSSSRFSFRPSAKSNPGLTAFESELCSQLEELASTHEAGYLRTSWLCQALGVVLCAHASVEAFVPDLQQVLADGDKKWLDEYLEDSVKLLDICNALREAITDIRDYLVLVELALRSLEKCRMGEAQLKRAKNALTKCSETLKRRDEDVNHLGQRRSKLESCSSMLRRMGEKLNMEEASKGNFFTVIYAAQVTTIFVCGVLTAAFSFKARRPLSIISVGGQSPWSMSLNNLQQRVKEQVDRKKAKGACALFEELDKTDVAVRYLGELVEKMLTNKTFPLATYQIEEIRESLGSLLDCSLELSHGLPPLELHVGEVFKVLINSRMALLDIYSHF